jgi:hypothetical protein
MKRTIQQLYSSLHRGALYIMARELLTAGFAGLHREAGRIGGFI